MEEMCTQKNCVYRGTGYTEGSTVSYMQIFNSMESQHPWPLCYLRVNCTDILKVTYVCICII